LAIGGIDIFTFHSALIHLSEMRVCVKYFLNFVYCDADPARAEEMAQKHIAGYLASYKTPRKSR